MVPQDTPRGSGTRSELVDILQAYQKTMEVLGLSSPGVLEHAVEEMRAALSGTLVEKPIVAVERGPDTPEWGQFEEYVRRAFFVVPPDSAVPLDSEERAAQLVATSFFQGAWAAMTVAFADPHAPLAPVTSELAVVTVASAVSDFLRWRRAVENGAPVWEDMDLEVENEEWLEEYKEALAISFPGVTLSPKAKQLAYMRASVAMELNLARSPVFSGSKQLAGPVQLSLLRVGSLYGKPFNVFEPNGPLTVPDAQLLAHLIKRYAEDGFPSDRRVRMSLSEAARAYGYSEVGGKQRELVRASFRRMTSTTYHHQGRLPDGTEWSLSWHLLDRSGTWKKPRDEGLALAVLSEDLVRLLYAGSLVYLQKDLFAELVGRDGYAARLWVFLESETLPKEWFYPLFSAPEGEPERERDTPAIADMLRMGWGERRSIVFRIRKAARVISEVDPRYSLSVIKPKGRRTTGMWNLQVRKHKHPVEKPQVRGGATGYSQERYRVLPVTLPGTPSNASTTKTLMPTGFASTVPSVLPSVLPSEEGFDFLESQLGEPFGVSVEELRNPESNWYKTLERASSCFRDWVPTYFGGVDPERTEKLVRDLLREMVVGLSEQGPDNPLRYLSVTIKAAKSPNTLLVADYALASLKRRYAEKE